MHSINVERTVCASRPRPFTNLTQDHLDYHETFGAYRDAKARLFSRLDADAVAVVNRDDPNHEALLRECKARVVTYAVDAAADVTAAITRDSISGTLYRICIGGSGAGDGKRAGRTAQCVQRAGGCGVGWRSGRSAGGD